MFSTKGQEVKQGGGISKSLQPGVVLAHIYGANIRTSTKSDKKALELILEGPELENFEGWLIDRSNEDGPKFKGQSAKVMATNWTDQHNQTNVMKNEIMFKITVIAEQMGLRDKLNTIAADTLEGWVEQAIDIMRGHDIYFFLKAAEEEYNGKTIIKLSLPKFKFCSSDESKLDKFDKNNKFHYKSLDNKPVSGFEPATTDDFEV